MGRQFQRGGASDENPFTVVSVVADARTISLAKPDPMLIYVPYWFRCDNSAGLIVRTRENPASVAEEIRQAIRSIDRSVPVPTVRALGTIVADSVANQRFETQLLLFFAANALFLASLSVYGIVSYSVVQRNREIGLRLALGAQVSDVYRLVLQDGLLPVLLGIAGGLALAFNMTRIVAGMLFETSPYDPFLTAGSASILLCVGVSACLLPAKRAAAVDPMLALRAE